MTVSNVGIANVLSDPFGKTATEIMSYLLKHTADSMDEKAIRKLIKKGAKSKSDEIIEAIKGYNIETDQSKNTDYEELMNPQNHVERVVLNESNVFAYLESLGYDSSKLVKRNDN